MDLLAAIREGHAHVEWANLVSEYQGHKLTLRVFRDAMKFKGVRRPATARVMQQIADLTFCMMPTPKILDLLWIEAGKTGVQFDPVINHGGKIVADLSPEVVSALVDEKIAKKGDNGGLIASVGKYWVLSNRLRSAGLQYGTRTACNYGWHSSTGKYLAVTPGLKVWQSQGCRHDDNHVDASQVIRLISRVATLQRAGSSLIEEVDLLTIAKDRALAPLINHDGPLLYLRQMSVPEPATTRNPDGSYTTADLVIL